MSFSSRSRFGCLDCIGVQKLHVWCPALVIILLAIVSVARFEAVRLTTDILSSPCTIVESEMADVMTCTLCDEMEPATCETFPISMARITVNFRHAVLGDNITGTVWYCKDKMSEEPCTAVHTRDNQDQYGLDLSLFARTEPVACTTAEILREIEQWKNRKSVNCYYANSDMRGESVWLTVPPPGTVDHVYFAAHLEYAVWVALGGLVLLALLLGCLAVEGAELYFSGLV